MDLNAECPIPRDVQHLLAQGEHPVAAYGTSRDIFTNMPHAERSDPAMSRFHTQMDGWLYLGT